MFAITKKLIDQLYDMAEGITLSQEPTEEEAEALDRVLEGYAYKTEAWEDKFSAALDLMGVTGRRYFDLGVQAAFLYLSQELDRAVEGTPDGHYWEPLWGATRDLVIGNEIQEYEDFRALRDNAEKAARNTHKPGEPQADYWWPRHEAKTNEDKLKGLREYLTGEDPNYIDLEVQGYRQYLEAKEKARAGIVKGREPGKH